MKYLILYSVLFFCHNTYAQKHDYIWHFGIGDTSLSRAFALDFNYPNDSVYAIDRNIQVGLDNASICDTAGNLLCYTNGISIQDSSHQMMLNGDSLNPGFFSSGNYAYYGYPTWEGALFLPVPNHDSLYQLFHIGMDSSDPSGGLYDKLYVTTINMNLNGGKGEVLSKNYILLEDSLFSELEAVKHGNGRDWWIVVPEAYSNGSNGYFRFLLTPDSIYGPYYQQIGPAYPAVATGQASFSPDGTKYARYSPYNDLDILDFDRCTGLFSNNIHIPIVDIGDSGGGAGGGIAFSPSSRYLYVSSIFIVYQYDMWASNIPNSKDTVAVYDGFYFLLPQMSTYFFLAQLAPNGKIYLCCSNGIPFLHVIHHPDFAGLACDFRQHDLQFPSFYNTITMPNFAHYRTPVLAGLCDTSMVVQQVEEVEVGISVYPNPAEEQINVVWTTLENKTNNRIIIYNALGQEIYQTKCNHINTLAIDVKDWDAGIYICKLYQGDRNVFAEKFVVVR